MEDGPVPSLILTERDVVEAILLAAKIESLATGKAPETILKKQQGRETSLCDKALSHIEQGRVKALIV